MRILVTNDDGVDSPGIVALAQSLQRAGHETVVVAPNSDRSGSSAAIGAVHRSGPIPFTEHAWTDFPDVRVLSIDAPPATAVYAACLGGFGDPPDLVASGVNPGANTGHLVLHSGTVGAALTAANFGVSGLAVSIGVGDPYRWDTAAELAVAALGWLVDQPAKTVLNLNVPNLPREEVRGVRTASLAPFGTVRAALVESQGGGLQMELAEHGVELPPDSDTALVQAGFTSVTSLVGIRAAEGVDVRGAVEAVARIVAGREARSA
jgi:5'-nucleotidase